MLSLAITQGKTPAIIVNEILMMPRRDVHFLVEGATDSKFWKKFLDDDVAEIVLCEGRPQLLGAMDLWSRQDRPSIHIMGVYDKDYDQLMGYDLRHPDYLARTDANDLEVMLVTSVALKAVLDEFADATLVGDFEQKNGIEVPDHIEKVSREFGRLRFLNEHKNLNVDFGNLSPHRFVSTDDWLLNLEGLHEYFCQLTNMDPPTLDNTLSTFCAVANKWCYSQGHDTLKILAIGLKSVIGRHQRNEDDLAGELRLAYTREMLERTAMFASLHEKGKRIELSLFRESSINRSAYP